jgi:hypothetical protein
MPVDRESAAARADQLTREGLERGETDFYWVEVERSPGDWDVEERPVRRGLLRRVWDAFWDTPS